MLKLNVSFKAPKLSTSKYIDLNKVDQKECLLQDKALLEGKWRFRLVVHAEIEIEVIYYSKLNALD